MLPARREALILGAVGLGAAAFGALIGSFASQSGSGAAELLSARYQDLSGQPRRLIDWRGKALLCNFWATWCAPCLEEIPLLVVAQRKYGPKSAQVVGIGLDHAVKLAEFASRFQINYPVLVGGAESVDTMRRLGNASGGLPYTVILDRSGAIAHRKLGALSHQEIDQVLVPLLE